jgi:hypothetical protein
MTPAKESSQPETGESKVTSVREIMNTIIAGLALVIACFSLWMQREERREKHAEILNYVIGSERVNAKEVDQYFKIYNYSERDIYVESVALKADMGDGLYRIVNLYEPTTPKQLHPSEYTEFRFRLNPTTSAETALEKSPEYATYTGRSVVEVETTKGTRLTFESDYHPSLLDRMNKVLAGSKKRDQNTLTIPAVESK